ncbi:myb-like protein l [Quercus suber]|uniref:Myb-like protein l n=1 Tax=Quercus suber TaxID=58331 RepID=A0AAW0L0I8_QUESU
MYYGPAENSHVTNYRMALTTFPLSLERKKWSKAERENLGKGIRQQFQEMVLQISVDQLSDLDGSCGDSNDFDKILVSIKDLEVTPENLREFLPKVNWEQLASMYVVGRSGAECEVRWLNYEDPLINHNPWTTMEDKNLLLLVQEKGIINWFDIAVSLGTDRTPFQCLARYQRSLNASILKGAWTKDEDAQLCAAVEVFGESDWQSVASTLEGRAGTQCSNRYFETRNWVWGSLSKPQQQVDASSLSLEKETSNNLIVHRTNSSEGFTDSEDFCNTHPLSENLGIQPSSFVENHQPGASKSPMLPLKKSSFPKSALLLMDAIKKNRSSQKFIRSQLVNLEARIEENKKLKERVKILKDFQASCKKRTGRALSQRKDPRVQLISVKKSLVSKDYHKSYQQPNKMVSQQIRK